MNTLSLRKLLPACAVIALSGCGAEFDSVSQLEGLRILGVQKSAPYAEPGERVDLRMLYHDTGERAEDEAEGAPRDLSLFWLAGCHNPPADLFGLCLEVFNRAFTELDIDEPFEDLEPAESLELLAGLQERGISFGTSDSFSFNVPKDIISSRPPPSDPGTRPYGLSTVFFAACTGELQLDVEGGGQFPMVCLDERGRRLGSEDFVAGYTQVFAYDDLRNRNPRIRGFEVDGRALDDALLCIGEDCDVLVPNPERECEDDAPVVRACPEDTEPADCDELRFQVIVDDEVVDRDDLLADRRGEEIEEQIWVNYHTDRGSMRFDVALINDATTGFNPEPYSEYRANDVKGPAHVWAIVRDNRGGTDWARFSVCVE